MRTIRRLAILAGIAWPLSLAAAGWDASWPSQIPSDVGIRTDRRARIASQPALDNIVELCRDVPCFVASRFAPGDVPEPRPDDPAVVVIAPSADGGNRRQITAVTQRHLGAVFGIAVDPVGGSLYLSAYNKAGTSFGPLGPGGIYRLDLRSGDLDEFAKMPAGEDLHDIWYGSEQSYFDDAAGPETGRLSLGGLAVNSRDRTLFAVNMLDRQIYVWSLDTGQLLRSFEALGPSGAETSTGRPFGLAVHRGLVYYAVVDSMEGSDLGTPLTGHVFRSQADGTSQEEVLRFGLDYKRADKRGRWEPWSDTDGFAQPMISDIEFDNDDTMYLALRDRRVDSHIWRYAPGDVLRAVPDAAGKWKLEPAADLFGGGANWWTSPYGSLAIEESGGRRRIVSTAFGISVLSTAGLLWLNENSGVAESSEQLFSAEELPGWYSIGKKVSGLGDLELLSTKVEPTPTATWTATATATSTPTPSPIPTLTPPPSPIYLPRIDRQHCRAGQERVDVALVIDTSTSMSDPTTPSGPSKLSEAVRAARDFVLQLRLPTDRVTLVQFDSGARVAVPLTGDAERLLRGLDALSQASGSRIDEGLRAARDELTAQSAQPSSTRAIVLLTDGEPTGTSPSDVLRQAGDAKRSGITVITIGLGRDLDSALLQAVASAPALYYAAADTADLREIYRGIAATIPCRVE